ncbi:MAG: peptide ABC transporter permease [Roseateles depolymerans]|uniref:Peptide ABC transporter permease n=1 Tax=Roseateles depolymerans TaxID=76731 RepID=A0A2W5E555_9BURK|nr:MAG: peptide ABC transporter permease [Roseateles depolymerans]
MKFVLLWTDLALWLMAATVVGYAWRVARQAHLRANWRRVLRDPVAACAGLLIALFFLVALADSVHLRRALPTDGDARGAVVYDTRTLSVLDLLLARPLAMREVSYSLPLAAYGFNRESLVDAGGQTRRDYPRLRWGGAHLQDPARERAADVAWRAGLGLVAGLIAALGVVGLAAAGLASAHGGWRRALADLAADRTDYPLRALLATGTVVLLLAGMVMALMPYYHVFGTDRTGNDVLVQALKSLRTAFVIGALSTLATLPLALALGVLAGYFKGWVDELIQYLYTTLSSVPNVLLIAACVLMVQVFFDKNPDLFETAAERSDLKMLTLCVILGLTGWAGLCRLVRAETLKVRELDYVQAATAFGVGHLRIMVRHIVPNVLHLVLITLVLSFSELILYEAVLTYVGVGVDPAMNSFGSMINLARAEMSRDPVVWWSFLTAFVFMVGLVLAANLFADGVRDAFDPKARAARLQWRRHKGGEHA